MRKHRRQLGACMGAPGPHDFAVRDRAARRSAHPRPPQPASRVVTIAIRPSAIEAGWRIANANFWKNERRIFLREGLDSPNQFELLQEISSCVHRFERRQAE
jgi:hypothetical protein